MRSLTMPTAQRWINVGCSRATWVALVAGVVVGASLVVMFPALQSTPWNDAHNVAVVNAANSNVAGIAASSHEAENMPTASPTAERCPVSVTAGTGGSGSALQLLDIVLPLAATQAQVANAGMAVLTLTHARNHGTRVDDISATWGQWVPRDRHFIVSDESDASRRILGFPQTKGDYALSISKWMHGFLHVGQLVESGQLSLSWLVCGDDDTFFLVS